MFNGCTSLTTAPELPATTLVTNCYAAMFNDCSSLSSVEVAFTAWSPTSAATNYWLNNVAASGTFTCPVALDTTTRDVSHVPVGWNVDNGNVPFYIEAVDAGTTVKLVKTRSGMQTVHLQYSTDSL